MNNLQHTFWTAHYNELVKSINLQEKSLYTWALLLKEANKECTYWVKNREMITGLKFDNINNDVLKKQNARMNLINHIINYFVNDDKTDNYELCTTPVSEYNTQQVADRIVDQSNVEEDSEFCQIALTTDLCAQQQHITDKETLEEPQPITDKETLEELVKNEELLKFAGQVLLGPSQEEKELIELMDKRRSDLQSQQETEQVLIKEREQASRENNLANREMTDAELLENINSLMANDHMKVTQVAHGPPPEDPAKKNIVKEGDVVEYTKPYSRPGAPINALMKLNSVAKQNELLQRMYLNAKNTILTATANKPISDKEKDKLIQEEADRLLQVYLDTH